MDACVGYARKHKLFLPTEMVSTKTLYNEIWAGNLVLKPLELPEALKRKKCYKSTAKRKKAYGTTIDERPEIASSRLEVGHWEGDTVVGKRNGKEAVILTLLEKKTQHYLAIRIPGRTGEAVNAAMQKLREDFGEPFFSQIFKTITVITGQSLRILPKQNSSGRRFTLPTLIHPGNGHRTSGKTVCSVDMSPKESLLRTSQMRRFSGPQMRSTVYPAGIWDTARRRNCLRLSWISSTQPERLQKPQF